MLRLSFVFVALLFGCEYLQPTGKEKVKIIAKAGGQELTEENIIGLIPQNISFNDSSTFVEKFVDDWIKKQLS